MHDNEWQIDLKNVSPDRRELICAKVVDILRPLTAQVVLDVVSDVDQLPAHIEAAYQSLLALSMPYRTFTGRLKKSHGMGVELDVASEDQWRLFKTFVAYSVWATMLDNERRECAIFNDSGDSIVVYNRTNASHIASELSRLNFRSR